MAIKIIGLGPADKNLLTLETYNLLNDYNKDNKKIFFRTEIHPAAQQLKEEGIEFLNLDNYYQSGETFEEVYEKITNNLIEEAREQDIIYAVPGHPNFCESTVSLLIEKAEKEGIPIEILNSISFVSPIASALRTDLGQGIELINSYDILDGLRINPRHPIIITQIFDPYILSDVKLKLMEVLPDDTEVILLRNAGLPDEVSEKVRLFELDRLEANHLTSLYIPEQKSLNNTFEDIVDVTRTLRMPGGCPWDREQTHESLKRYILEEAAEVVEAIESEDIDNLQEELGDLLFQVLIHSQIADEENYFDIYDVIKTLTEKMIRRHPHVFGDFKADTPEDVFIKWDKIKETEKPPQTISEVMRGLPKSLSALLVSDKIQTKARKVGFDWDDSLQAFEKVKEEVEEVEQAFKEDDTEQLKEELGDLLFAVVNVIRLLDMDPEDVLRQANKKFINRFEKMEKKAAEDNVTLEMLNLDQMEELWQQVK